jgi:hypothetical protein
MSKELILISTHGSGYFNGSSDDGWSYNEVERTHEIDPEYIFGSLKEIHDLPEYDSKLRYWYQIGKVSEQSLKPKCPYPHNSYTFQLLNVDSKMRHVRSAEQTFLLKNLI